MLNMKYNRYSVCYKALIRDQETPLPYTDLSSIPRFQDHAAAARLQSFLL